MKINTEKELTKFGWDSNESVIKFISERIGIGKQDLLDIEYFLFSL